MTGFHQLKYIFSERCSLYEDNNTQQFQEINVLFQEYGAIIQWGIKIIENKDLTEENKAALTKAGKFFVTVKNTFQQRFDTREKNRYFSHDNELNKKLIEIFESELSLYGCALDEFQNREYQK
jgi:uncharacterized Rmd1/YagE family protein